MAIDKTLIRTLLRAEDAVRFKALTLLGPRRQQLLAFADALRAERRIEEKGDTQEVVTP